MHPALLHQGEHIEERVEVVVEVFERFGDRFPNGFECREVDNRVEVVFVEDLSFEGLDVAAVHLFEWNGVSDDLFDAFYCGEFRVGEVIRNDHVVPCMDKFHGGMGTDVPGPTGHEYCFLFIGRHGMCE